VVAYFVSNEFLDPENVEFDNNIAIHRCCIADLWPVSCTLVAILFFDICGLSRRYKLGPMIWHVKYNMYYKKNLLGSWPYLFLVDFYHYLII
jgi:hypothetical protein